jgi:hypothetical protein
MTRPGPNYKTPRRINVVTILGALVAVTLVYGAVKVVPIYVKRSKIDEILKESANEAGDIQRMQPMPQRDIERRIVESTIGKIQGEGLTVPGNGLHVYFDSGYKRLHADYVVFVKHPFGLFGQYTRLTMRRSAAVSTGGGF